MIGQLTKVQGGKLQTKLLLLRAIEFVEHHGEEGTPVINAAEALAVVCGRDAREQLYAARTMDLIDFFEGHEVTCIDDNCPCRFARTMDPGTREF